MKTAGEILSGLFDKKFVEKAKGYSKFFDSWTDILEKNGIGNAAAYSRIKDLDKGIVLIELDHPGWKQILQTKQSKILNDFRYRFPQLDITGISLMLGREEKKEYPHTAQAVRQDCRRHREEKEPIPNIVVQSDVPNDSTNKGLDAIKDEDFKQKLRQLGQTIADSERRP